MENSKDKKTSMKGRPAKSTKLRSGLCQFSYSKDYQPLDDATPDDSQQQMSISRVNEDVLPATRSGFDFSLTQKLRPGKQHLDGHYENIITGLEQQQMLVNMVHRHAKKCTSVKPPKIVISDRKGLLVNISINYCHTCKTDFKAIPMTGEMANKMNGPKASILNKRLSLACLKSKVGIEDIRLVLAMLDIQAPSRSLMYKHLNNVGDSLIYENKLAMEQHQELIQKYHNDHGREALVGIQTDTAYNNRPQTGFEAGTQAFCAAIEDTTGLVIACETANKLCRKKNCKHENCSQTLSPSSTIASSERTLAERNIKSIEQKGHVKITAVTSDASSQLDKLLRDLNKGRELKMKHFICLVHRLRTVQKALKKLKFTFIKDNSEKNKFTAAIRRRILWEIKWGMRKKRTSAQIQRAIAHLVKCFCGDHSTCKKDSVVCSGNPKRPPKHLPGGKYAKLTLKDCNNILRTLHNYFAGVKLDSIHGEKNTNQCENVHSVLFTYAPKHTTYARNFPAMSHSAVHSKAYGPGRSTALLAKKLHLNNNDTTNTPFTMHMAKKDKQSKYDSMRQNTREFKKTRYINKRRKINICETKGSCYKLDGVQQQHNYAYKPD